MDDGRLFIYPIRPGWRMVSGKLKYCKGWEIEDMEQTSTERTRRVIEGTMGNIMTGLVMTMETKNDFDGEWLPTLDVSLAITAGNRLKFKYFEKPTSSNLTIQKRSAMEQNTKVGILANEVVRRMLNIGGEMVGNERKEVLDKFAVKLLTSGFQTEQTRRILLSGVRGYEAKVKRREAEGILLYRTSEESIGSRDKKKLLGKSTWFKGGGKRTCSSVPGGVKRGVKRKRMEEVSRTRSVLFVEHTPGGELAKRLREQLLRMETLMGFHIKVIERTGTKLKDLFSLTNVWGGMKCERGDCTTCNQECEDLPDCTRRSVVYESICARCNPEVKGTGPLRTPKEGTPSIYVGESSRSLYERAGEHWSSYQKRNTDSHIWKHHLIHHGGEGTPEMVFKLVGTYRSALTRQVSEAVRIRGRGSAVLNSKSEYDRCKIHRLTIEGEEFSKNVPMRGNESENLNSQDGTEGEQYLFQKRKQMDKKMGMTGTEVCRATMSQKRGINPDDGGDIGRASKKRKFVLVGEWGTTTSKGLECKTGDVTTRSEAPRYLKCTPWTSPLINNGGEENEKLDTGPLTTGDLDVSTTPVQLDTVEEDVPRVPEDTQCTPPLDIAMESGGKKKSYAGPLSKVGRKDSGDTIGGQDSGDRMDKKQQVLEKYLIKNSKPKVVNTSVENSRSGSIIPNEGTLYDAASNVLVMRSMKGDCLVRRGWCQEHGLKAVKSTTVSDVWTRNKKTGLYYYKKRRVSVLKCSGQRPTLVANMDQIDGAGGKGLTEGESFG